MQVDSHAGLKTDGEAGSRPDGADRQGQKVGTMTVTAPDFPAMTVPVYAAQTVDRASIFARAWNSMFGKH